MDPVGGQRQAAAGSLISVKPFIGRIEFRKHNNQDLHAADGSVADARRNYKGLQRLHGDEFTVEFEVSVSFAAQDYVGFREGLVVMQPCIFTDFSDVQCAGEFSDTVERPSGSAAGAGNAGDL